MGNVGNFRPANGYQGEQPPKRKTAHVIVCGNEKGGSGKTTTTMHLVVSLLKSGFKVATIDLDTRQQSLTRYIQNRRTWAKYNNADLELPSHYRFDTSTLDSSLEAQSQDFSSLVSAVTDVQDTHDFVVIDTPGSNNYLMRLAHSMADTLITPMNDSFVDFDVLGRIDTQSLEISEISHYATMVREARRQRRMVDNGLLDWIVVRNRLSSLSSRNQSSLLASLQALSMRLGFRIAEGISERVIFREFFPIGLTALDTVDHDRTQSNLARSHLAARQEVRKLVRSLRLPIDDQGIRRAKARRTWLEQSNAPVSMPDVFVD